MSCICTPYPYGDGLDRECPVHGETPPSGGTVEAVAGSRTPCEHCGSPGADFSYEGHDLCCECMSAFISWILDGGMVEEPEMFAFMIEDEQSGREHVWSDSMKGKTAVKICDHCGKVWHFAEEQQLADVGPCRVCQWFPCTMQRPQSGRTDGS